MNQFLKLASDNLLVSTLVVGLGCEIGQGSRTPQAQTAQQDSVSPGEVVPTGRLSVARAAHTATLLPNGTVLLVGGMGGAGATAESYDPARGSFIPAGRMVSERAGGHAAVLLPTGSVLLTGGWTGPAVTASAELYDPSTNTFSVAGTMNSPRSAHTATLLPTGKVLIAGGFDGSRRLESSELYDPRTGTFTPTGSMAEPRSEYAAVLFLDGRVLVTGGNRSSGHVLASAEIYDPIIGMFRRIGNMTMIRHKHAATALRDGKVLIIGGSDARDGRGRYASAEVFDPTTGTFVAVNAMNAERFKLPHAVVLLRTGEVLVAGGAERAEVYDPATNRFRISAGSVGADLSFSTATLLRDGRVLISGGYDSRIQPTTGAWLYRSQQ
ncbi:MAG: Kelch repeat-containing protein [Gemmatimonadaceae bacterium]